MAKSMTILSPKMIRNAYDDLVEINFFETMGGWNVSKDRIEKLLGKAVADRYWQWMETL